MFFYRKKNRISNHAQTAIYYQQTIYNKKKRFGISKSQNIRRLGCYRIVRTRSNTCYFIFFMNSLKQTIRDVRKPLFPDNFAIAKKVFKMKPYWGI